MLKIIIRNIRFFFAAIFIIAISCVKDNSPGDCVKPVTPTVLKSITANQGSTVNLSASGVNGAKYYWSGPNSFYAVGSSPSVNYISLNSTGNYWVKAQVGYCYSDSVSTLVVVKTDSLCSLGDNGAVFPNGSGGPFTMHSACATGPSNSYIITSSNVDSTLTISTAFKSKPSSGSAYTLTDSHSPADNEIFYQVKDIRGDLFYSKGNVAFVKVKNGKINIIICNTNFPGLGVFSANITCQ